MSNVISVDFNKGDEKFGYVSSESDGIGGVFADGATIIKVDGGAALASSVNGGYEYSDVISVEDMNRLCTMWLAIFSPDSIKFDDEE